MQIVIISAAFSFVTALCTRMCHNWRKGTLRTSFCLFCLDSMNSCPKRDISCKISHNVLYGHQSHCELWIPCAHIRPRMPRVRSLSTRRVRSHAPSIPSHRGTKVVWPDFQPMRVPEEPVCIDIFRQNPVFTSLHLKSPVHVHRLSTFTKVNEVILIKATWYEYFPFSNKNY